MSNAMSKVPLKVAIKYGIGEGDYHGRAMVRELKAAGFKVVRNAKKADVVVTHSGGCFFLPPPELNQVIVLINPPYWPGKSLVISTLQKVMIDFIDYTWDGKIGPWLFKTIVNLVHLMRYILRAVTITLHAHKQRFYQALRDDSTIIIRNERDSFLAPDADRLLRDRAGRNFQFIELPGQHDTCWRDPKPYVDIVRTAADAKYREI